MEHCVNQRIAGVDEQCLGDRMRNAERHDAHQRVGGTLEAQDAVRVLIKKEPLVGQGGERLGHAGNRAVVRRQVACGKAWRDPQRSPDVQRER